MQTTMREANDRGGAVHNLTHKLETARFQPVNLKRDILGSSLCFFQIQLVRLHRGYECLLVEDATESYFPEFKAATLAMITAQNAIVGWTARAADVVAAMR